MKANIFQSFIDKIYRHPKGKIKHVRRFGGYYQYRQMMQANEMMQKAAFALQPVASHKDGLPVFFLTGHNFFYQTLFCITSLTKVSREKFKFYIVDDGSLDMVLAQEKLPGAVIIEKSEINQNLEEHLPEKLFPVIRKKRALYPHLKKLTDIHSIGSEKWKLVMDSDMLFWQEPHEIINWIKDPQDNLFMVDITQSYGYSEPLMQKLCGYVIPPLLNVGVVGMKSSAINWEHIEKWIQELEAAEGGNYYLEQALTAMLAAGSNYSVLPNNDYIVYPTTAQALNSAGVLHHYVDLSKKEYFNSCWKKIAN